MIANPAISVIVPVYNVEKYLERCVHSITAQTFSDFEIILVDDGSTDSSGAMCDALAKEDARIRVIHKENGGLSDARNAGIDAARGTYVEFVDSDDFIEQRNLEILYDLAITQSADIAIGSIYNCYGNKKSPQCPTLQTFQCNGREALKHMLEGILIPGSSCCKLIHHDLVKNRYFLFGKTYEDAFYLPELLLTANNISVTTEPLYNYWHRTNSITTLPFSVKCMDVIEAYQYTAQLVQNRYPEILPVATFRLYWAHFVVLDRLLTTENFRNIPQYSKVVLFLKRNWLQIFQCTYFQKSRRIAALALKINVNLYRWLNILKDRRHEVSE